MNPRRSFSSTPASRDSWVLPGEGIDRVDQAKRGAAEVNFYVETFLMWAILVILAVAVTPWRGRGK